MSRHEELLAGIADARRAVLETEMERRRRYETLDDAVFAAYVGGVPVFRIVEAGRWATRKSVRDALLRHRERTLEWEAQR